MVGNRASLIKFAAWAIATDRTNTLKGEGRLSKAGALPDVMDVEVATFRRRIRDDISYATSTSDERPHPAMPPERLERILALVRRIETERGTNTLEFLARRFLGPSDDQLIATVGEHWWPRLRRLDRWRDPADVLIAAEAAINHLGSGRRVDVADIAGLTAVMRALALLLAGGYGSTNQAVARAAVLMWHLWNLPDGQGEGVLHAFADAVRERPGNNLALRALDRSVRSHHDQSSFVSAVGALYDEVTAEGPSLDAWLPGSYLTRLTRVLGHYGDEERRVRSIEVLRASACHEGSTMTHRRACAWGLLETIRTDAGWTAWSAAATVLEAEDAERQVKEFTSILAVAPAGADRDTVVGRLLRGGARRTTLAHYDLVNAHVHYVLDDALERPQALVLPIVGKMPDLLDTVLPEKDERLRRFPGWSDQTSVTRRSARLLLLETMLTPSVIRADTAVETLLAAGPAVKGGCQHVVERAFERTVIHQSDGIPRWLQERLMSLVGFFRARRFIDDLVGVASDARRDDFVRARAALVVGDLVSARDHDDSTAPDVERDLVSRATVGGATEAMRTLLDSSATPVPLQVAAVRTLGQARFGADDALLLELAQGRSPDGGREVHPSVRRMAAWAVETLNSPFR